jgi:hypothetical protein
VQWNCKFRLLDDDRGQTLACTCDLGIHSHVVGCFQINGKSFPLIKGQLMGIPHQIKPQAAIKRIPLKELGALLLFVVAGGALAMPCLCIEGAIAGRYKVILFFSVALRLGWCIHRRTFRFRDYFIYFAIVVAFCLWADSHF